MDKNSKLHKQFLANRAKNFARRRKRWEDWKRARNRRYRSVSKLEREELSVQDKYSDYVWIKPPSNFSMITNTEDSLAFISKLERCFGLRQKVFVNLSEVKIIAHGALVVLLSIMKKFKANNIGFNGYMYNRQNEKCNFEKRKVHFLVFSGHFGRVCLTAVQSSLKRCLIG